MPLPDPKWVICGFPPTSEPRALGDVVRGPRPSFSTGPPFQDPVGSNTSRALPAASLSSLPMATSCQLVPSVGGMTPTVQQSVTQQKVQRSWAVLHLLVLSKECVCGGEVIREDTACGPYPLCGPSQAQLSSWLSGEGLLSTADSPAHHPFPGFLSSFQFVPQQAQRGRACLSTLWALRGPVRDTCSYSHYFLVLLVKPGPPTLPSPPWPPTGALGRRIKEMVKRGTTFC